VIPVEEGSAGGGGAAGGGGPDAGCASGFMKDQYGRCLPMNLTEESILGGEIYTTENKINQALDFIANLGAKSTQKMPSSGGLDNGGAVRKPHSKEEDIDSLSKEEREEEKEERTQEGGRKG